MDATFMGLLTGTGTIERPTVELDGDGAPKTPRFEPTGESVRVRITPVRSVSEDGLLGRMEDVTHVIYSEPADIRVRDRIAVGAGSTERRFDAVGVVDAAGMGHHLRVVAREVVGR